MLNKKALEAACEVYKNSGKIPGPSRLKDAIEAYLAALPDNEDGLVPELRAGAKILVERPGEWYDAVKTLRGAADALEAARAKIQRRRELDSMANEDCRELAAAPKVSDG